MAKNKIISIVDGSNLFFSLVEKKLPTRLHYTRLCISIAKRLPPDCSPWIYRETIYNTSSPRQADNKERYRYWLEFQNMLKRTDRMTLKLGRLEGPKGALREKGVDINITNDIIGKAYLNEYDILILVTGDGDYRSSVEIVKGMGKKIFVSFFQDRKSYHLDQAADGFIPLPNTPMALDKFKYYRYR